MSLTNQQGVQKSQSLANSTFFYVLIHKVSVQLKSWITILKVVWTTFASAGLLKMSTTSHRRAGRYGLVIKSKFFSPTILISRDFFLSLYVHKHKLQLTEGIKQHIFFILTSYLGNWPEFKGRNLISQRKALSSAVKQIYCTPTFGSNSLQTVYAGSCLFLQYLMYLQILVIS